MTNSVTCEHPASKLTFSKMFLNDNGGFGGQVINILLDCQCGDTIFVYSYRGNVSQQYIQPNNVLHRDSKKDLTKLKQQEVW